LKNALVVNAWQSVAQVGVNPSPAFVRVPRSNRPRRRRWQLRAWWPYHRL